MPGTARLARIQELLASEGLSREVADALLAEVQSAIEERRELDREVRSLAEAGFDGMALAIDMKLAEIDQGFLDLLGYRREELLGGGPEQIVPKESLPGVIAHMRSGSGSRHITTALRKDGTRIVVEVIGREVTVDGRSARLAGFRRITHPPEAERALADLKQRFRSFADLVPVAMAETDARGRLAFMNRAGLRMQGFQSLDAALGQDVIDFVHPVDRDRAGANFSRRIGGEDPGPVEYRMLSADGREYPALLMSSPLMRGEEVVGLHVAVVDLTDRREAEQSRARLEAQVQHAQKLESLGVLAGGIAHDFNNLLGVILGNADLALDHLDDETPARPPLDGIRRAARRAAELTQQMLAYSGAGAVRFEPVDLESLVEEMSDLLRVGVSKSAHVTFDFAADLPPVQGDAARLQQVVLNLLTNAGEALGEGRGNIEVSAWEETVTETTGAPVDVGTWVVLEVADDGVGMPPETVGRIFDPFFSTKFAGRGLGLAAVMGIVSTHGGALEVETALGEGSTFRVWLPAASQQVAPVTGAQASGPWKGRGTVLVVDDEPDMRDLLAAMLSHVGFDVRATGDGGEALRWLDAGALDAVAVLLDVTMPAPGGPEVFAHLVERGDRPPVIVTSGYLEADALERFGEPGPDAFLHKPFRLADLVAVLRKLTDTAADQSVSKVV